MVTQINVGQYWKKLTALFWVTRGWLYLDRPSIAPKPFVHPLVYMTHLWLSSVSDDIPDWWYCKCSPSNFVIGLYPWGFVWKEHHNCQLFYAAAGINKIGWYRTLVWGYCLHVRPLIFSEVSPWPFLLMAVPYLNIDHSFWADMLLVIAGTAFVLTSSGGRQYIYCF